VPTSEINSAIIITIILVMLVIIIILVNNKAVIDSGHGVWTEVWPHKMRQISANTRIHINE
jgi:hypothetical protein